MPRYVQSFLCLFPCALVITLLTPPVWSQAEPAPEAQPAEVPAPAEAPVPAETPAPPEPATAAPVEAPPAPEPEPVAAEVAPVTPPPAAAAVAPPPAEVEEPPEDDALGDLSVGVWGRVDIVLSDGEDLDDVQSTGVVELHTSGRVHEYVGLTGNLVASYGPDIAGTANLLDAIVQFDFADPFHVWLGRMLVPVDRSNFSGSWFMAPWFFPGFGFADGQVTAPREGPNGRNNGATVWGYFAGGLIKYYAGAYDLHDVSQSPLFSGRLNLSLISPEPGYYSNSIYYGKDILAIGAGFQQKKDGSLGIPTDPTDPTTAPAPDDYTEFNADILFEKDLGPGGVLDIEGAFYKFKGDNEPTDLGWMGVVSYLLPTQIGIGKVQPSFRIQQAKPSDDAGDTATLIDAQLGYVMNDFAARLALGYRHGKAGDLKTQALFLGAQVMK